MNLKTGEQVNIQSTVTLVLLVNEWRSTEKVSIKCISDWISKSQKNLTLFDTYSKVMKWIIIISQLVLLAISCTGDMKYNDCGSACPKSCDNLLTTSKCSEDCIDGCFCPADLYYDKYTKKCIPRTQCSCYRDGIHYKHGSVRSGQCEDW